MKGVFTWVMILFLQTDGIWRVSPLIPRSYLALKPMGTMPLLQSMGFNGWPITSWNMVTITYDGTNNPLIYINGLVVPTTGTFVNPASSGNSLIFGLGVGPYGLNDLDGDIWLPQIWSKVLSPMDIATSIATSCSVFVGHERVPRASTVIFSGP